MVSRGKIQVIVLVTLVVILVLSFVTSKLNTTTLFRSYSLAVTVVAGLFVSYERILWRWKPIRKVSGIPLLAGTWRGTLISSFKRDGKQIDPVLVAVTISQSASNIYVTLFTEESSSTSQQALLIKDADGRYRLSWQYTNTPRPAARENASNIHHGASELFVGTQPGEGLNGSYFTDRDTHGEITFTEWSPKRYGRFAAANDATDFSEPNPFA